MSIKDIASHPLQSFEWGDFRKKTGVKVVRQNGFQLTIHKIPHMPWTIGYLPKSQLPTREMILELIKIGKQERCIFIQLEPNVEKSQITNHKSQINNNSQNSNNLRFENWNLFGIWKLEIGNFQLVSSFHPLFTKYTFILDLTKSEDELLKAMHPKTRYNIKVALKHGIEITQDNSDEAFEIYLKLTAETTKRQGFYAHTEKYHRLMWETLRVESGKPVLSEVEGLKEEKLDKDKLTAHLFLAKYNPNSQLVLAAWILFVYNDTLYYPYGASSNQHRETMASNLMMWEVIRFGKKLELKKFDMWGALGPNPDVKDPWYGFHRFKEGYGPKLTESIGSFDLVINPMLYEVYKILDKVRWALLKIKK